ncbi:MAG: hypothetical protein NVS9B9_04540 [Ktedonobacteraceae bacterium]
MAVRKQEVNEHDDTNQQHTKRSRITFDVSPELRRRIKVAAAQNNLSIGDFLSGIIEQELPDETSLVTQQRHPPTQEMLDDLDQISDLIMQERNGKPFENLKEEIRQMREERSQELESI